MLNHLAVGSREHKTQSKIMTNNYEVIDQMFSAVLSQNESKERIKALRPQVEEAVKELLRELGKPANFTGIIEYHGFTIALMQ